MFGKKKILNIKSSYLPYFKEKNHEIWNVNSKRVFPELYVKNSISWFQEKKVFWDLNPNIIWTLESRFQNGKEPITNISLSNYVYDHTPT